PGAPGRAGRAGPASRVYLPERSGNGALHGGPVTAADAPGAVPAGAAARGRGLRAFFGIPSPWVGVNVGHVFRTNPLGAVTLCGGDSIRGCAGRQVAAPANGLLNCNPAEDTMKRFLTSAAAVVFTLAVADTALA